MATWQESMDSLCDTASYFSTCNVMDINFVDGSTSEVYVAISKEQRHQGLAQVSSIDLDGMLFVYDKPSLVPFTMAKMNIDLDIGWYDERGKLIKWKMCVAGTTEPQFCPTPFSYVLECPAGTLNINDLLIKVKENNG
jgi:uncharacterized membrane protein (UPF0127 family)